MAVLLVHRKLLSLLLVPLLVSAFSPSRISERRLHQREIFNSVSFRLQQAKSAQASQASASTTAAPSKLTTTTPKKFESPVPGPPKDTRPDYENIHGPLGKFVDRIFLAVFRSQLAKQVGADSSLPKTDYNGIIELAGAMNARYSNRQEIQRRAKAVLIALFPSWMPSSYSVLFSKPFPAFSSRMNAWATRVAGTWLMGECEINDVEVDGGAIGKSQGLLVKRCRFLEESGCASVCVNSCKVPTQNFFLQEMGLPLTMEPNYDTFECQFSFGATPNPASELEAKNTPCLSRCPTAGSLRKWHDGRPESATGSVESPSMCDLMEDE